MEQNNSTAAPSSADGKGSKGPTTQKKMLIPRVIWAGLVSSNLLFLGMIMVLPGGNGTPMEPLKLVAGILILAGLFLGHGPALRPPMEKAMKVFLPSVLLCESFSILGFLMHTLWSEPNAPWYAIGGLIATLSLFPRTRKFIAQ